MGRAARRAEHLRVPCFFNGLGPRHVCPPTTSSRSCAPAALLKQRRRSRGRDRHPARLPARVRTVRRRPRSPTSSTALSQRAAPPRRADRRRRHRRDPRRHCRPRRAASRPRRLDRRAARRRDAAAAAEQQLLDGRPTRRSSPTRDLRRARRRLARDAVVICDGGDFASYAGKFVEVFEPGLLARHRSLRLSRQRPRATRSRRGSARPVEPDRRAARRRRRRLLLDGCRLAGPPQPSGRDGRRQQRDVGSREAPDAGDLRVGRCLRSATGMPLRRGRESARWRRRVR